MRGASGFAPLVHRLFKTAFGPPRDNKEGMARRPAQSLQCPRSFGSRRAPYGAPHALFLVRYRASRYLSALQRRATSRAHAYLRRSSGTGPRFSPGLPVRNLRASSWRGLLVVPGGAPAPPECFVCVTKPAGAAPRPAYATPRDGAPQWTRWAQFNGGLKGEDKERRHDEERRQRRVSKHGGALREGRVSAAPQGDDKAPRVATPVG
jgi:hypothetical protein